MGLFWILRVLVGIFLIVLQPMDIACFEKMSVKKEGVGMRNTAEKFIGEQVRKGQKSNRLIHEKSPYLLQHAFNPVDWFPWGDEAFDKARLENKPIFLSIGYSTCHWCHVMAHESFENPEIAGILNRYFVAVKVDREERPDLDQVYMAVTQAMTGSGGWPMSLFLSPDLKPFFAGTYFPPESKYGRPGFGDLLTSVQQAWQKDAESITARGSDIIAELDALTIQGHSSGALDLSILEKAAGDFSRIFDTQYGGFGSSPKFPRPVALSFLLRQYALSQDERLLGIVTKTLDGMADGGMYDHVGGGFHRYSVDEAWRVPHFEKMLYDQALLVNSYIEAYQVTGVVRYKDVAMNVLDFVIDEMQDGQGGYYSAFDADSALPEDSEQHSEGAFYLWSWDEIDSLVPPKDVELFSSVYGVRKDGNAFADPQKEFVGKNILYRSLSSKDAAVKFGKNTDEIDTILSSCLEKLKQRRASRPHPHLDDKVLTSWNGLMISAMAKGFQVFREERFLNSALKAALFSRTTLFDGKRHLLLHRFRDGDVGIDGNLDDYAFLVQGFLDLYEASFDSGWINFAEELSGIQTKLFADQENGGFFDTSGVDKTVLLRMKADYDGAEPAGNSVAALNLFRLGRMLKIDDLSRAGDTTVNAFAQQIEKAPLAMPHMLSSFSFQSAKTVQIVIAGRRHEPSTEKMMASLFSFFLPNKIVYFSDGSPMLPGGPDITFLANMTMLNDKATAYLCFDYTCKQPTDDPDTLLALLEQAASPDERLKGFL